MISKSKQNGSKPKQNTERYEDVPKSTVEYEAYQSVQKKYGAYKIKIIYQLKKSHVRQSTPPFPLFLGYYTLITLQGKSIMFVKIDDTYTRKIHREGKWHLKIIGVTEKYTKKRNAYLRITCISADDRLFYFPLYLHSNDNRLFYDLAHAIGYENVLTTELGEEVIDSKKFVGGFFYAILSKYEGDNEAYESGYYVKSVWSSSRRYDVTGSHTFKRVRISNRKYCVYEG